MNKLIGSSANPENISLTIKSIGVWLIPAIIMIAKYNQIELSQSELVDFINLLSATTAGLMTIFGVVRKIYYFFR